MTVATFDRLRLDPWAAEYESALQIAGRADEPVGEVVLDVEAVPWATLRPPRGASTEAAFVDGVRRVEHRFVVEGSARPGSGVLGSFGVGATRVNGRAEVEPEPVRRLACIAGGEAIEPVVVPVSRGDALIFEPELVADPHPLAPLEGLQEAMRRAETALARRLVARVPMVVLDGPLSYLTDDDAPVLGFVKRLVGTYLPPERAALLRTLEVGERTPLFLIKDPRCARYSWYMRIGRGRRFDATLAGVVRLEIGGGLPVAEVVRRADEATARLPEFASHAARDPRAPQNLLPVGGLEGVLRHRLGDPDLIRRAIEARFATAAEAVDEVASYNDQNSGIRR